MRSEVPTLVTVRITIFEHMTSCHLLEEPAVSIFTVEYAGTSFLQNVDKSVPQHKTWHHMTEEGTFQK
jgi:hypothetical protein